MAEDIFNQFLNRCAEDCVNADHGDERAEAEQYLADAAAADTHGSDVDPGRVDPWAER